MENTRKFKGGDKVKILYKYPFTADCFNVGEVGTVLNWIPFGDPTLYAVEGKNGTWEHFDENKISLAAESV